MGSASWLLVLWAGTGAGSGSPATGSATRQGEPVGIEFRGGMNVPGRSMPVNVTSGRVTFDATTNGWPVASAELGLEQRTELPVALGCERGLPDASAGLLRAPRRAWGPRSPGSQGRGYDDEGCGDGEDEGRDDELGHDPAAKARDVGRLDDDRCRHEHVPLTLVRAG